MDPDQDAFLAFMMGGKSPPVMNTPSPSKRDRKPTPSSSAKDHRRAGPIIKAFQGRIEDWKHCDDQLAQVLNSIVNLRDRIFWESKKLEESKTPQKPWTSNGYRSFRQTTLLVEDIETALANDLLSHERMLAGARTLISSMAQAQDAMGRRIDEMYEFDSAITSQRQVTFEAMLGIFHFLGEELYRKQTLISEVLDSCHNGLIDETSKDNFLHDGNPRSTARKCYNRWSSVKDKSGAWEIVNSALLRFPV